MRPLELFDLALPVDERPELLPPDPLNPLAKISSSIPYPRNIAIPSLVLSMKG